MSTSDRDKRKTLARRARLRERMLGDMLLDSNGELSATIDALAIGTRHGLSYDDMRDRCLEMSRAGYFEAITYSPEPAEIHCSLSLRGIRRAERLIQSWHVQLWREHKHAILTGVLSIIASILGGIAGGVFVLLAQ